MSAASQTEHFVRVQPSRGRVPFNWRELWEFRELLYILTWRDIKVRYKQTALGALWALIQPLLTMAVFSLFFGRLGRMPSDGIPYPVFALCGLVPWMFFANSLSQSSNSMLGSAHLITKVFFPRLLLPASSVLAGLLDMSISFFALVAVMLFYGIHPSWRAMAAAPILMLAVCAALGAGLWLSALAVRFRDVRHALPFLVQFWMIATPIAYPSSLLHEPWRSIFALNPMVGVVEGLRWALAGTGAAPAAAVAVSGLSAAAVLYTGALYFRQVERTFADIV